MPVLSKATLIPKLSSCRCFIYLVLTDGVELFSTQMYRECVALSTENRRKFGDDPLWKSVFGFGRSIIFVPRWQGGFRAIFSRNCPVQSGGVLRMPRSPRRPLAGRCRTRQKVSSGPDPDRSRSPSLFEGKFDWSTVPIRTRSAQPGKLS
jgi:hypothetical protein